jgi:hypothetical protein
MRKNSSTPGWELHPTKGWRKCALSKMNIKPKPPTPAQQLYRILQLI